MNTETHTNGASHAHALDTLANTATRTHAHDTDDADEKRPAAVIDSVTITRADAALRKVDARIAAYTVARSDEETIASLALVREGLAAALTAIAALPAMLVDVSAAVERGKRPRGGEIVAGSTVRIRPKHRATFAGHVSADVLAGEHAVTSVNDACVFLRIGDTTLPLKRSQVELAREAAFEPGEIVRIAAKHTARVAAEFAIDASALDDDLSVAACNGDKVTLRATVNGGSMLLPNVKAANVERI